MSTSLKRKRPWQPADDLERRVTELSAFLEAVQPATSLTTHAGRLGALRELLRLRGVPIAQLAIEPDGDWPPRVAENHRRDPPDT